MEEDFGGGQDLTKGCGAKGRRRRRRRRRNLLEIGHLKDRGDRRITLKQIKELGCDDVDYITQAQDKVQLYNHQILKMVYNPRT
jgi:hypothetical protein